jgi:hypothetical protein
MRSSTQLFQSKRAIGIGMVKTIADRREGPVVKSAPPDQGSVKAIRPLIPGAERRPAAATPKPGDRAQFAKLERHALADETSRAALTKTAVIPVMEKWPSLRGTNPLNLQASAVRRTRAVVVSAVLAPTSVRACDKGVLRRTVPLE